MQAPPQTPLAAESHLAELRKHALEGNFDRLEDTWIRMMESGDAGSSNVLEFLDAAERFLRDRRKVDRVGALLELLLGIVKEAASPRDVLRLYRLLLTCFPEKREYRAAFFEGFEQLYPLASAERAFYDAAGVSSAGDILGALVRLDRLLKFSDGAFVYHRAGWGVGRVVAVDPFLKQVKVDLEGKRQHRVAIDVVDSILEALPSDGFLALRHAGGAELKRLAEEDPIRLVNLTVDAFGSPMALKDLKSKLVPDAILPDGWSRWWTKAKGQLRETSLFRVGDRAPYLVERLEKAVSYEDDLLSSYGRSDWPKARQIARLVSRRGAGELSRAWERIREHLRQLVANSKPEVSIEAALILDRGEGDEGQSALKQVTSNLDATALLDALGTLTVVEDQRRVIEVLPLLRESDWLDLAGKLFLGRRDSLRAAALALLESRARDRAGELLADVVRSPKSAPEAFCYLLSTHTDGSDSSATALLRDKTSRELLVLLLDLLEHMQHKGMRGGRAVLKDLLARIEDLLVEKDCKLFRAGLTEMVSLDREDVHRRLVKSDSLTPQARGKLLDVLMAFEPQLARALEVPPWEEKAIYVTAKGLARKQDEFRELMEVKLPKNFEDIGRAAAFGDLSENAEYTAALEERDQLTKRAGRMKADLDMARVIDPAALKPGFVGLGSTVLLRNKRNKEELAYSILGPWDGSPGDGVLSYTSPLGGMFLGRKVGEVVEAQLPGGRETFELLAVKSWFDEAK